VSNSPQLTAKVRRIKDWSPIWFVPVMAVLIGLWMLVHSYQNQGATLTLIVSDAEGIVAGKTQIKSRNVDVGRVVSMELSQDLKQVVLKAQMNPGTSALLNDESKLWVVKPTVGRGGVSGLNTLLSGAYIELQPGQGQTSKFYYELLDSPPVAPADAAGIRIQLTSNDAAALSVGDPVLFRGYDVGTVERSEFDPAARLMRYQLFIRAPYDALVTENVRFWQSSGMAVDMSADGVRVEMASLASLLGGGVTFDVIEGWPVGKPAQNNASYQLFSSKKFIKEGLYNEYLEYLLFFDESIRGLSVGAPVEYRGVRVGTVVSVPHFVKMEQPLKLALYRGIPVLVRIEAGRLYDGLTLAALQQEIEDAVQQGLRAVLKTGSLLTGALYVDLNFVEAPASSASNRVASTTAASANPAESLNEAAANVIAHAALPQLNPSGFSQYAGYTVLPTSRSGLGQIEQKVVQVLDKVNKLPVEAVLQQGAATLEETQRMLQQSQQLMQSLDRILAQPSTQALPQELQQSLQQMRQTLQGVSPGSPVYERLNSNLQALDKVMRDLQPVIQTLNQQSNALILGNDGDKDPEPRQGTQP
jgi:paraquat-inducible protein B